MEENDRELAAIKAIAIAIADLDEAERGRVFDYISSRFGISFSKNIVDSQPVFAASPAVGGREITNPLPSEQSTVPIDIRSLKEDRKPTGAMQMSVLVAYYLKALAPSDERKDVVATEDIERYFTQAQFPLPTGKNGALDSLNNARKAGYFEPAAGQGQYKLNSVGFNLAAYGMPTAKTAGSSPSRKTVKKIVKKTSKKK